MDNRQPNLSLDPSKTEFLIVELREQLTKFTNLSYLFPAGIASFVSCSSSPVRNL